MLASKIFNTISALFRPKRSVTLKQCRKGVCGRGTAPDPAAGAYDAPPEFLVGWGGAYPLPNPHPLGTCGVSTLASLAPHVIERLRIFFLHMALMMRSTMRI